MCFVHVHVHICAYLCVTSMVAYASAFDVCTAIINVCMYNFACIYVGTCMYLYLFAIQVCILH